IFWIFCAFSTFFATVPSPSLFDHRHLDEVPDLLELPHERGVNVLHDFVLMMMQADRFERRAHPPRVADAAAHLLDPNFTCVGKLQLGRLLWATRAVPDECTRH